MNMVEMYHNVMDYHRNPLRHIKDFNTRHMLSQTIAWMWCVAFSLSIGSITVFGITTLAHCLIIAAIFLTVAAFEQAEEQSIEKIVKPYKSKYSGRAANGEHY